LSSLDSNIANFAAAVDRQQLFHSPSAFHVATIFIRSPDQELFSRVRDFVKASEGAGAKVVYAGSVNAV
jgi:hypothetical protein